MVEKTRNQVVAQAARGFESHPIRQKTIPRHRRGIVFAYAELYYFEQLFRQKRQHFHIGHIVTVLPTGNGFVGRAELLSKLLLHHTFLFSQGGYEFPDSDLIHFYIHPKKSIAQLPRECLPTNSESASLMMNG